MMKPDTKTGETPSYELADLLTSRTDKVGAILSASEAFERISGYDWEDLKNAPHSLVRHPDMPKGVFWMIWNTLQRKKPLGVFLKNRAKSGSFYWVFAYLVPLGDGYLSISVKPANHAIEKISDEYAALLKLETETGLSAEQSAEHLLGRIQNLGFSTYDHFVASLAFEQIRARNKDLHRSDLDRIEKLATITTDWSKVRSQCNRIKESHKQISNTPTNLRVQAAHLNDKGNPLSVIATNFTTLAVEIEDVMKGFLSQASEVEAQLNESAFGVCLEALMQDVVSMLQSEETERAGIDWQTESMFVDAERNVANDKTYQALTAARHEINTFSDLLDETARIMSGLAVAKVMCEIENAYVGAGSSSGVTGIISQLDQFQSVARDCLFDIRFNLTQISQSIKTVQSNFGRIQNAA